MSYREVGGFVLSSPSSPSPSAKDSPAPSPTPSKEPCMDTDGDSPMKPGCTKTYTDNSCSNQGAYDEDKCGKDEKGNPTITEQICMLQAVGYKATCGTEECCDHSSSYTITCKDVCIADCKGRGIYNDPKLCETEGLLKYKCLNGIEQKVDCGPEWKGVQSAKCDCHNPPFY